MPRTLATESRLGRAARLTGHRGGEGDEAWTACGDVAARGARSAARGGGGTDPGRRRGADGRRGRDVRERRRADPAAEVPDLPPGRQHGADVPGDLAGDAAVGALHQGPRAVARDAALASRQDRRHPALHQRPVAERRADRHHRALGRRRGAARRPRRHAAAGGVAGRRPLRARGPAGTAGHRGRVAAVDDAGRRTGRVVPAAGRAEPDGARVGAGVRDQAVARRPPHRAPCVHLPAAAQGSGAHRGRAGAAGRTGRGGCGNRRRPEAGHRPRRGPRAVHGVGAGQAGRDLSGERRQAGA